MEPYSKRRGRRKPSNHLREVLRGEPVQGELRCSASWVPNRSEERDVERRLLGAVLAAPGMRPAVTAILGRQGVLADPATGHLAYCDTATVLAEVLELRGVVSLDALATALERCPVPSGSPTILEYVGGRDWLADCLADALIHGGEVIELALLVRRAALDRRRLGGFRLDDSERQEELELARHATRRTRKTSCA